MSISETFDLLTYLYTNVYRIYRELLILEKATASSRIMYDVSNWVFLTYHWVHCPQMPLTAAKLNPIEHLWTYTYIKNTNNLVVSVTKTLQDPILLWWNTQTYKVQLVTTGQKSYLWCNLVWFMLIAVKPYWILNKQMAQLQPTLT